MKRCLAVSVLANLLFAGSIIWLVQRPPSGNNQTRQFAGAEIATSSAESRPQAPGQERSPQPASVPFQWRQLESPDYPGYIANLRRIGCPEQTIREIIVADVDDLYNNRREELRRKTLAGDAAGSSARQALATGLQQLRNEETGVIEALLGIQPGSTEIATEAASSTANAPTQSVQEKLQAALPPALAKPPSMPLVFQPVDPASLNLNDRQLAIINELRQSFQQEIGGANQDTNDPAYLARWQAAQRNTDEMMAGMLGRQFRLNYEVQAEQTQNQGSPPQ